jgi:hypothetical protein
MLAHGFFCHAEPSADLGVGVPGGDQVQQFPLPGVSRGVVLRRRSASR